MGESIVAVRGRIFISRGTWTRIGVAVFHLEDLTVDHPGEGRDIRFLQDDAFHSTK